MALTTLNNQSLSAVTPIFFNCFASSAKNIPDNTATFIDINSATHDPLGFLDASNNRVTVPSAAGSGFMIISWRSAQNLSSNGDNTWARLYKNGAFIDTDLKFYAGNEGEAISYGGTTITSYNPGDFFQIAMLQDSGQNITATSRSGSTEAYITGYKI